MASNKNDIADMQPDDVWVVRLYFCFDDKEAFAVEGDLYGRLDFKNGEVKDYVFHANHTSFPEYEQGFLALSDNQEDLEFVTIDTNGRETTVHAGGTCRVEVVSTRQTKKPFLLRRSPRLMAGGQGCILNTNTNRCRKAKKGEADDGNCVFNTGTGRCRKKKAAPKKKKAAPKKKVEPDDEDVNSDFEDSEEEQSDDDDAKKPPSSSEDSDSEEDESDEEESPFGSMTDAQWHEELKSYLTEGNMLGKPGKDGVTYKVDYKGLRLAVKQFKPKKAFSSISKEANLQERAAETGAAPKVYHVSRTHKYIVMDRMAKRIVDVYGKGDTLSDKHQMELVDCFLKLDDADILHNDGNALNLMVDYDDRAIVIDFGLSNSPIKKKHRKKYTGSPNGAIVVYMMLISLKRYGLKAPILKAFVDASKTRAGLDAFLGKHGGVLQGGQGRTKKPFLRRSPRLTAGGQGCVLNKATNMCRKTKDGQVDDGNCMFNTVTGRCNKKKAAPKKKKKKAAPKKKVEPDDEDVNSDFEDSEEEQSDDDDAKKPPSSSEDSDSEEDESDEEESPFGSMTDAQWHEELKSYLTEGNMLGKPGKDGVTYKVDYKGLRLAVKQFKPKKAFSSISKEANLQERAAETGAAPKVYHVSRTHKYIVMDRMAKRIVDVYGKGDTLSDKHQMELVDCFLKLDDADILHNDGNALNLMVDYDDRAIVIDFGLSNSPIKKKHRKKYTGSPNGAIVVYMMLISLKRYGLKAPILKAFVDASKTRAGLDAFLGKHGGVLQGGQGRTKKPFLRRSPRLTAGGQGCVLNKATNMCRKTKDGQVDDGNCMFNTVTGRCNKKKAAPKKKKKKAAPKKKKKKAAPKKKRATGRLSARYYVDEMDGQAGDKVDIYEDSEYKCLAWKESPVSVLIPKWEVSLLYKGPKMNVGTLLHVTFECIGEEGTKICTEECTVRSSSDATDKYQNRLGLSELTVRLSNRPKNGSMIKFTAKNYKCLAYRKGKNGPVPYWAKIGSPAAKKLGCE